MFSQSCHKLVLVLYTFTFVGTDADDDDDDERNIAKIYEKRRRIRRKKEILIFISWEKDKILRNIFLCLTVKLTLSTF